MDPNHKENRRMLSQLYRGSMTTGLVLVNIACSSGGESGSTSSGSATSGAGGNGSAVADCKDGWCRVPAGSFIKGSPPEEYGHSSNSEGQTPITISRAFIVQQNELSRQDWAQMGSRDPTEDEPNVDAVCSEPTCPVVQLTWFEAAAYANWLSEQKGRPACYAFEGCQGEIGEGFVCASFATPSSSISECRGYRLPTEAEWEYAYRATTLSAFYSGDILPQQGHQGDCELQPNLDSIAWYCWNSGNRMHASGQKAPNSWGLHDMAGNAFEWTHSVYKKDYASLPGVDPSPDGSTNSTRVFKGGGWNTWATLSRAASHLDTDWGGKLGVRLVRTLDPGETW